MTTIEQHLHELQGEHVTVSYVGPVGVTMCGQLEKGSVPAYTVAFRVKWGKSHMVFPMALVESVDAKKCHILLRAK